MLKLEEVEEEIEDDDVTEFIEEARDVLNENYTITIDYEECTPIDSSTSYNCTETEIEDCNDNCSPANWLGDGFCDDGSYEYNGNQIFFNCEEFNNDEGDCDGSFNRQQNQQHKFPNGRIQIGQ